MDTFSSLISGYGLTEFAEDIGVTANTAKQMRTRDSVPSGYWTAWVDGAERRGRVGITHERLAKLSRPRRKSAPSSDRVGVSA